MTNKTKLPFEGLRVVELDAYLISGRLTGMLFADQGAEVVILSSGKAANSKVTKITDGDEVCEKRANDMLNRKVFSICFILLCFEQILLLNEKMKIIDHQGAFNNYVNC